ncbi:hypothetical protein FCULG_00003956 [Fusarium culmorum]|uniref:Uncharacterized protein n=1 Tax=Fusarium culmorum TaxID=5516 RepID=A0A2T4H922_FUSCU|nr:hypothetical protein FCULG_00003956 [Fusarium culmorum]
MRGMAAPLAARRVTEYQTEVTYVDFEVTLDSGTRGGHEARHQKRKNEYGTLKKGPEGRDT